MNEEQLIAIEEQSGNGVVAIPSTGGLSILVDASDVDLVRPYTLWVKRPKHVRRKTHFYALISIDSRCVRLHRFLLNAAPGVLVDHVNGNTLDNRRCNLRVATKAQNAANSNPKTGNRFKGVTWQANSRKYFASIGFSGRTIYIGRFDLAEDAARAYDRKARELFGEFARPNFPTG